MNPVRLFRIHLAVNWRLHWFDKNDYTSDDRHCTKQAGNDNTGTCTVNELVSLQRRNLKSEFWIICFLIISLKKEALVNRGTRGKLVSAVMIKIQSLNFSLAKSISFTDVGLRFILLLSLRGTLLKQTKLNFYNFNIGQCDKGRAPTSALTLTMQMKRELRAGKLMIP